MRLHGVLLTSFWKTLEQGACATSSQQSSTWRRLSNAARSLRLRQIDTGQEAVSQVPVALPTMLKRVLFESWGILCNSEGPTCSSCVSRRIDVWKATSASAARSPATVAKYFWRNVFANTDLGTCIILRRKPIYFYISHNSEPEAPMCCKVFIESS